MISVRPGPGLPTVHEGIDPGIPQANGNVLRLEVQGGGDPQNKRVRTGDVTVLYQTQ